MVSLEHLVDHYMRFPDGLPIQIRNPLSTKVNLTPKAPSPSQALIAKHKNKKDPELPSHNSSSNSSNSSITLCSSTEKISPPPPRDMPKPNVVTVPSQIEDLPSPDTLNWADGVVLVYSITERGSFNFIKQVWNIFQVGNGKSIKMFSQFETEIIITRRLKAVKAKTCPWFY